MTRILLCILICVSVLAATFIADTKMKKTRLSTVVALQNTQDGLRRVEDQIKEYTEEVKKLTEKLESFKKAMVPEKE